VNRPDGRAQFKSASFGDTNAIARHGIHGFQWNYEVPIPGQLLHQGENTIFLSQSFGGFPFNNIMYDYLRLEGPVGA
jgi:rhamnogalacturonan endolyase